MQPKVLLIEDDNVMQETFREYLEPSYHVVTANCAKDASDKLKEQNFNILLVDLGLPDDNGLTIIKTAFLHHKSTTVIALTGDASGDSVTAAIDLGVDDYIVKPISQPQLLSRIHKAITKHKFRH